MGTFSIPPPHIPQIIANINMITSSKIPFDDPWNMPSESDLDYYGNEMPLIPYESTYVVVQSLYDISSTNTNQMNVVSEESSSLSSLAMTSFSYPFQQVFSTDENI